MQGHLSQERRDAPLPLAGQHLPNRRRQIAHPGIQANGPKRIALQTRFSAIRRLPSIYERYREWDIENLIKLRKSQLASDRTSCRSPIANQVRLVLHTGAYWLMLTVRDAIPTTRDLARAEFATLRLRLIKIAARVIETTSRVRLAFAAACPEADLFRGLPGALAPPSQ
jgi:hypothetical protein